MDSWDKKINWLSLQLTQWKLFISQVATMIRMPTVTHLSIRKKFKSFNKKSTNKLEKRSKKCTWSQKLRKWKRWLICLYALKRMITNSKFKKWIFMIRVSKKNLSRSRKEIQNPESQPQFCLKQLQTQITLKK